MPTTWLTRSDTVLLLALTAFLACLPAHAAPTNSPSQPPASPAADRPPAASATNRPPEGRPQPPAALTPGNLLDERQRDLVREALREHAEAFRDLEASLRDAQRDLAMTLLAAEPDEKEIREKAEAVAKIQVKQTLLRAKVAAVVSPTLTPEQRELIEKNPAALGALMSHLNYSGNLGGPRPDRPGQDRERRDRSHPEQNRPQRPERRPN